MYASGKVLGSARSRHMHQCISPVLRKCCYQHRARYFLGSAAVLHASATYHASKAEDHSHGYSRVGWSVSASRLPRKLSLTILSAAIASICRLHGLHVLANTDDITWDSPSSAIWSAIELNVGIICASLPTLRPFFTKIWPRAFLSSYNSRMANLEPANGTKGHYYNMEGSIVVKKTVAVQSTRILGEDDKITEHSSDQPGVSVSGGVTADSQEELATWSKR